MRALTSALRAGADRLICEIEPHRVLRARSSHKKVGDTTLSLSGSYLFTTEKGLFRIDGNGIYEIMPFAAYGLALAGDRFFISVTTAAYTFILRGDTDALYKRKSLNFEEIYRARVTGTNERIHGIYNGGDDILVANTARNTILCIDAATGQPDREIAPFIDAFGKPILHNHNHINSVAEYAGVILFVAYRAGDRSLIGLLDGERLCGFGYKNVGVHDILLYGDGFLFCDTFGTNTPNAGGCLVTNDGIVDEPFFSAAPGYVVRGVAGDDDELLVGYSHKGERARRFDGHGGLLLLRGNKVADRMEISAAQVYQIMCEDGSFTRHNDAAKTFDELRQTFAAALGDPVIERRHGAPVVTPTTMTAGISQSSFCN